MRLFFLGIGGTLMGNLAVLAKSLGHQVSGSDDILYPPMSDLLSQSGIEVNEGFEDACLDPLPDLVVMGNARCGRGHPGVEAVLEKGLPYVSGAEWLGSHLLPGRWTMAVAGTHGKTSGASMLAWIMEQAGTDPGYLIGGAPLNFETAARVGESPWFVVEADEYDCSYFDRRAKFLHYRPRTLIINNLEYDHADIYEDLASIETQFHHLLRAVPATGLVVTPLGDQALDRVIARGCWSNRESIAIGDARADWSAELSSVDASAFRVLHKGKTVAEVRWSQCGEHMVANALGALAASNHAGVDPALAAKALCSYKGVRRRLELILEKKNLRLYDDFAHHPTAIRKTLGSLRKRALAEDPQSEVVAVIEPRSHTMSLGTLRDDLSSSTEDADRVFWFRSEKITWDMDFLVARSFSPAQVETSLDRLVQMLAELPPGPGTRHIVLMSNGRFGGIQNKLKDRLTSH